tara:strand:+ start:23275 stop:23385 length:111 start_codon:yes stop_codon:yes gene_type:complete
MINAKKADYFGFFCKLKTKSVNAYVLERVTIPSDKL